MQYVTTLIKELDDPMLRPDDVALMLNVHRNTVYRIPSSELPYIKIVDRGDRRYRKSAVIAYLEAREVR